MLVGLCSEDPDRLRDVARVLRAAGFETLAAPGRDAARRLLGVDSGVAAIVVEAHLVDVVRLLRDVGQSAPALTLGTTYAARTLVDAIEALTVSGPRPVPGAAGLVLDPARHSIRTDHGEALLTPTELRMLAAISARPGEVVRRHAVVAAAWPDGARVSENTIDSFVRRIRRKLQAVESPAAIQTVRGVGYRLVPEAPEVPDGADAAVASQVVGR